MWLAFPINVIITIVFYIVLVVFFFRLVFSIYHSSCAFQFTLSNISKYIYMLPIGSLDTTNEIVI